MRYWIGLAAFALSSPAWAGDVSGIDTAIPVSTASTEIGSGMASWFGDEIAGQRTASGATCDPDQLTAAHRNLPFGSKVLVTNLSNGKEVVVTITDRGPYARGRLIDLSRAAAEEIGLKSQGHGEVSLALVSN